MMNKNKSHNSKKDDLSWHPRSITIPIELDRLSRDFVLEAISIRRIIMDVLVEKHKKEKWFTMPTIRPRNIKKMLSEYGRDPYLLTGPHERSIMNWLKGSLRQISSKRFLNHPHVNNKLLGVTRFYFNKAQSKKQFIDGSVFYIPGIGEFIIPDEEMYKVEKRGKIRIDYIDIISIGRKIFYAKLYLSNHYSPIGDSLTDTITTVTLSDELNPIVNANGIWISVEDLSNYRNDSVRILTSEYAMTLEESSNGIVDRLVNFGGGTTELSVDTLKISRLWYERESLRDALVLSADEIVDKIVTKSTKLKIDYKPYLPHHRLLVSAIARALKKSNYWEVEKLTEQSRNFSYELHRVVDESDPESSKMKTNDYF